MNNMSGMPMPASAPGPDRQPPTMGTHGMLLVGQETIYLSHLPMFMAPHNFQAILEVTLNDDARRLLGDSRAHFGPDALYTCKPADFPIADLVSSGPGLPLRSFKGDLYRGHFERGGTVIAPAASVHVEAVVYFAELTSAVSKSAELVYLLFGKGKEFFLAHWITQPPDFDQVLSVNVGGLESILAANGTPEKILQGITVAFPGRRNTPDARPKPGEKLPGRGHATGAHQLLDLDVEAIAELYLEEGELRE